jgi:hypothetical protein
MHHFLFLPYTSDGRWKGCGDHLYVLFRSISISISDEELVSAFPPPFYRTRINTFAVFVNVGLLPSADSNENPTVPLSTELTYSYLHDGSMMWCRMGRGWWLKYNPPMDPLAPETSFSEGRMMWQIPPPPPSAVQEVAQIAQVAQVENGDEAGEEVNSDADD